MLALRLRPLGIWPYFGLGLRFKFNLATLTLAAAISGHSKAQKPHPAPPDNKAPTPENTSASARHMQSAGKTGKQLGQLVMAVKVLNFRIYGMPCIVILTLICKLV